MLRNSDPKIKLEILYWKFGKMLPDCLTKRNIFQIMLIIACWFKMLQYFLLMAQIMAVSFLLN